MKIKFDITSLISLGLEQGKSLEFISSAIIFYLDEQCLTLFGNNWDKLHELEHLREEITAFLKQFEIMQR